MRAEVQFRPLLYYCEFVFYFMFSCFLWYLLYNIYSKCIEFVAKCTILANTVRLEEGRPRAGQPNMTMVAAVKATIQVKATLQLC